jgi:hypothetical protein
MVILQLRRPQTVGLAELSLEKLVHLYMFRRLMRPESHRVLTKAARRECVAIFRGYLMGRTVIVPVKFAVDNIIDPGGWCCIALPEYITVLFRAGRSRLPTHFEPGAAVAIVAMGDAHAHADHGTAKHSAIHKVHPFRFH